MNSDIRERVTLKVLFFTEKYMRPPNYVILGQEEMIDAHKLTLIGYSLPSKISDVDPDEKRTRFFYTQFEKLEVLECSELSCVKVGYLE